MPRPGKSMGLKRPDFLLEVDKSQFNRELIRYLNELVDVLEKNHRNFKDAIDNGFKTKNWQGVEVGDNLEFQRKIDNTYTKKGAITGNV